MITITTKNAPGQLVEKINTLIKNKRITTWDIDDENDYILNIDEYRYKAWMSIDDRIEGNTLFFCIIESRKYALTKEIYAVYHCKFAEMLLEYFDTEIDNLQITFQEFTQQYTTSANRLSHLIFVNHRLKITL